MSLPVLHYASLANALSVQGLRSRPKKELSWTTRVRRFLICRLINRRHIIGLYRCAVEPTCIHCGESFIR